MEANQPTIKCIVWDLDNTLWDGILLEDEHITLRPHVIEIIRQLDQRGILHSVASRNDATTAIAKLREVGLVDYFLYPQIGWESKVQAIELIAQSINIGLDAIAFVDDETVERAEVAFSLPEVMCIDAAEVPRLLNMPAMNPQSVTEDARLRRLRYLGDWQRKKAEAEFSGPSEDFLATLDMRFTIFRAAEEDLKRAEELTKRTHQLNTTGYTYSYDELDAFRQSPHHQLLITTLEDKFGTYGIVGLALIERQLKSWTIRLLLMSCRVQSRGVGTVFVNWIMQTARQSGASLRAEFRHNGRNRMMYMTYMLAGFKPVNDTENPVILILEDTGQRSPAFPVYLRLEDLT